MKKIIFRILAIMTVFIIIAICVSILEVSTFYIEKAKYKKLSDSSSFFDANECKYNSKIEIFKIEKGMFREKVSFGKKHTFLFFGCSFTLGSKLKDNETFPYQLAKITNSTAYNKAFAGWGPQYMLYQLKHTALLKDVKSPDYVIYTYIDDHINRCNNHFWSFVYSGVLNIRYVDKNNKLVYEPTFINPLYYSFFIRDIVMTFDSKYNATHYKENFELCTKIFLESQKLIKIKYPKAKFVILLYSPCVEEPFKNDLNKQYVNELEKNGIEIIEVKNIVKEDLSKQKYHFDGDGHPSKYAWPLVAEGLKKELKL